MTNNYIPLLDQEAERDSTNYALKLIEKIDNEWFNLNDRDRLLSAIKWSYLDGMSSGIAIAEKANEEIPF